MVRKIKIDRQGVNKGKVLAVGSQAKKMIGRLANGAEVVRPLENGVVKDFDALVWMLDHYLKQIF